MNIDELAIIIPTYDNLEMLRPLIGQLKGFNVYVVEDGQKQETIDWLKTQDVTCIFHEKNKGVSPSWNDGLKRAEKDGYSYFAIFNDDIVLPDNWFTECKTTFESNNAHFVSLYPMSGWFFILDKVCLEKIGYFDEQFAPFCVEDDDYFERIRLHNINHAYVNINVIHHGSATINKIDKKFVQDTKASNWHKFRKKYPKKVMPAL